MRVMTFILALLLLALPAKADEYIGGEVMTSDVMQEDAFGAGFWYADLPAHCVEGQTKGAMKHWGWSVHLNAAVSDWGQDDPPWASVLTADMMAVVGVSDMLMLRMGGGLSYMVGERTWMEEVDCPEEQRSCDKWGRKPKPRCEEEEVCFEEQSEMKKDWCPRLRLGVGVQTGKWFGFFDVGSDKSYLVGVGVQI